VIAQPDAWSCLERVQPIGSHSSNQDHRRCRW